MTYSGFPSCNLPQSNHAASYRRSLWETEVGRVVTLAPLEGWGGLCEVVLRPEGGGAWRGGRGGEGGEGEEGRPAGPALKMCFRLSFVHISFVLFFVLLFSGGLGRKEIGGPTRTIGCHRCVEERRSGTKHGGNVTSNHRCCGIGGTAAVALRVPTCSGI